MVAGFPPDSAQFPPDMMLADVALSEILNIFRTEFSIDSLSLYTYIHITSKYDEITNVNCRL